MQRLMKLINLINDIPFLINIYRGKIIEKYMNKLN